jgi:undecaprenyl-diphosphatase
MILVFVMREGKYATMAYTAIMPLYQAVILALVQGLTEFLPISSSGHLALAPWLLGWKDPGLTFDIALHLGTLVAVVIYFFRDWVQVLCQGFGLNYGSDPELKLNRNLLWLMLAASVPAGIAGLALHDVAETTLREPPLGMYVIGGLLIGVGLLMWWAERIGRQQKDIRNMGLWDALVVGVAQAAAILPGTSRSGITITAGLFSGYNRGAAARFSFLLSTPIIAAAAAKAAWDLYKAGGVAPDMRTPFLVGVVVSGLSGTLVIAFLMRFLRQHSMNVFVWYRVALGILIIALAAAGR